MTPMIRMALALAVSQLVAFAALAQSAEFGRASGGEISVITKQPRRLSGSLGFSQSSGAARGQGYNATVGGSALDERLWFFASAAALPALQFASNYQAVDAKVTAQPVDWSSISASFSEGRQPIGNALQMQNGTLPSSFLSLRSTSMLSDSMVLNFSFTTRKAGQP